MSSKTYFKISTSIIEDNNKNNPNHLTKLILSSLSIKIPIEAIETVGLLYILTKAINWENINIVEIVSTLTEMTFILKEDDVSRAFNTVKKLIK